MQKKINEYITLKLGGCDTQIFINGDYYSVCKHLLIAIDVRDSKDVNKYAEFTTIDEIIKYRREYQNIHRDILNYKKPTPEEEFQGHCSNLEVWVENNYNIDVLHSQLALGILAKIMRDLQKDKEEFLKVFIQTVESLDNFYEKNPNHKVHFQFEFFYELIFWKKYFMKKMIESSNFLKSLKEYYGPTYLRGVEKRRRQARNQQQNYYERKLWGSDLEYRHFLRDIRNHKEGIEVSDPADYLPYLFATDKFHITKKISFTELPDGRIYIRDEFGDYHLFGI